MSQSTQVRRQAARMGVLLRMERDLWKAGHTYVAGVDEVGVGPLAGPVVAAAVVFSPESRIRGVDDSKKLSAVRREALAEHIRADAIGVGIGCVDVADVDVAARAALLLLLWRRRLLSAVQAVRVEGLVHGEELLREEAAHDEKAAHGGLLPR